MVTAEQRVLNLDSKVLEAWEIAAILDSLLAYPTAKEERLRNIIEARCSQQIRVTIKAFPERRKELWESYPHYKARKRTLTKNFQYYREQALLAGAVFLVMIQETATGPKPKVNPSLDALVRLNWPARKGECEDNYFTRVNDIEHRKVRARFPVAHLAAALQLLAFNEVGGPLADAEQGYYDYQDMVFLKRWVDVANELATYIRSTNGLETIASKLISLRWI